MPENAKISDQVNSAKACDVNEHQMVIEPHGPKHTVIIIHFSYESTRHACMHTHTQPHTYLHSKT